ncbi:MAG: hypothetical protein DRO99_03535, partial [Candidatus Aenigmatarchaeota archaeon]
VTGKTGTGKTAFSMSFLYDGAKNSEPGVYVTTEERVQDLKNDIMSMFGWEVEDMEKQGLLSFVSIMPSLPTRNIKDSDIAQLVKLYVYNLFTKIEQAVSKVNARRIVIDSVSLVEIFIKDEYLAKVALMQLVEKLKEMGITSLLTSGVPETTDALSSRGLIEFVVDSIVKLDFIPVTEEFKRTLLIRKMRRTNHSTLVHPMDITKEGLKIIEVKDIDKL